MSTTTTRFQRHVMLASDDQLRAGIADHALPFEAHMYLVTALHHRESARLAAETLAHNRVRWSEISNRTHVVTPEDDTPTGLAS